MTRLIKVSDDFLDDWGARTHDGRLVELSEWGQPDPVDGSYTPTFMATDDGHVILETVNVAALQSAYEAYKGLTERMRDYFAANAITVMNAFLLLENERIAEMERQAKIIHLPKGRKLD